MNVSIKVLLFTTVLLGLLSCNEKKEEPKKTDNTISEELTVARDKKTLVSLFIDWKKTNEDSSQQTYKSCVELMVNKGDLDNLKTKLLGYSEDPLEIKEQVVGQFCPRFIDGGWYSIKKNIVSLSWFLNNSIEDLKNDDPLKKYPKLNDPKGDEYFFIRNYENLNNPRNHTLDLGEYESLDNPLYILDIPLSVVVQTLNEDGETTSFTCLDLSFTGKTYEENKALVEEQFQKYREMEGDYRIVKHNRRCQFSYKIEKNDTTDYYKSYVTCEQMDDNVQTLKVIYSKDSDFLKKDDENNPGNQINKTYDEIAAEYDCVRDEDISDGEGRNLNVYFNDNERIQKGIYYFNEERITGQ